jgi:hypothetical protein
MGRKKKRPACPPGPADAERRVTQPGAEFGLGLGDVERYAARHTLRLGEDDDPRARAYLNPAAARYVVVAVDTAAGGEHSDEAFVVFLVSGAHFGLLSARIVVGHDRRYAFSTIPLVFVLALLETIRTTRRMLRAAHERSAYRRHAFRFPPVLVVLETNFAYGAAVYIQMLQMLDDKRPRFLVPFGVAPGLRHRRCRVRCLNDPALSTVDRDVTSQPAVRLLVRPGHENHLCV